MNRLFVSAAALPLLFVSVAQAETKISTATTTPVKTSTIANGAPDQITIDTAGSIAPTVAGAAVTIDSSNNVVNNGAISFNNVNGATAVQINGGVTTGLTNAGGIAVIEDYTPTDTDNDGDLDGPFAQGTNRYGIRATGPAPIAGAIVSSGTIGIEGNDSAGISLETRMNGPVTVSGGVTVTGDRGVGVRADSVGGDVKVLGTVTVQGEGSTAVRVGDVDGALVLQGAITATGYRSTTRLADDARAKLDADDLKQGGAAVRITGSLGKGLLLDRPPLDNDPNNADEDADGIADSAEGTAAIISYGAAPGIDIGGATATTLGAVGTGEQAYGIVNRGTISGLGVNDGISATGLRIGQAGGGTVTVRGGINNQGGTILARSYSAQATGLLLNAGAVVPALKNSGSIGAEENGGLHDARAIVDLSGSLSLIDNSGSIAAVINTTTGVAQTGRTIAIDLSANTTGAVIVQRKINSGDTPKITGDVLFGGGADRLQLLGGSFAGTVNFGAGADEFLIDGGATATARIVDSDGRLALAMGEGKLTLTNTGTVNLSALSLGAKSVLAVSLDPSITTTRLNVSGAATVATGAQVSVTLAGLSRGAKSYQVIQAGSLSVGQAGVTLAGAPFLYQAALRTDATAGALYVDLRPKTAAELGLNRSGSEAYSAVFESLDKNDAIEAAFLGQTTQAGFQGLYDQMLPDHSGGTLMSAAAISAAVSQAAGEPQRIDKDAATGIWAQEVVFNLRQDRVDAMGFKSQGFGFAAGIDNQGVRNALGVNVSFVTTDIKDRGVSADEQVTMNLFGTGVYWRYDGGPLQASARGGVGYAFLSGDRRLVSDTLNLKAKADWGAWMADAYAGVSYEWRAGGFYARPELSTSYTRLAEDGYHEKGGTTGFDLTVDKRTGDLLTGQALMAIGWRFGDDTYFAPEIKAGYRAKLAGGPARTTAHFDGGADFTLDPEDVFKGGAVVRAGVRGGSGPAIYVIDGGATFDGQYQEYDVRAVLRLQF